MPMEFRNEQKYVCREYQLRIIEQNIRNVCRKDPHVGETGSYVIRSVYFDDMWDTCYHDNDTGVDPREKFRIRVYNGSLERISLECKQKTHEKTHKDAVQISRDDMEAMLRGRYRYYGDDPVLQRFFLMENMKVLRPKAAVEYERTPYVYDEGNVRITFDRNICTYYDMLHFWKEDPCKSAVLPGGTHVLEIKYDAFLPDFLKNMIQTEGLQQTSYSKYYQCRRTGVKNGYGRLV